MKLRQIKRLAEIKKAKRLVVKDAKGKTQGKRVTDVREAE
jgi:hypothetical protein